MADAWRDDRLTMQTLRDVYANLNHAEPCAATAAATAAPPPAAAREEARRRAERAVAGAVFELGLRQCSPKVIKDLLARGAAAGSPASELTTEHIKSHLQKYRQHHDRSRQPFRHGRRQRRRGRRGAGGLRDTALLRPDSRDSAVLSPSVRPVPRHDGARHDGARHGGGGGARHGGPASAPACDRSPPCRDILISAQAAEVRGASSLAGAAADARRARAAAGARGARV